MVPLFDINAQHEPLEPELLAAFTRVLESGQFILGPEVATFEKAVATALETRHAIGVSSGTDAILLALMALGVGSGDEVLCPTFTFFATAGCVARLGAMPVFVDCCPACFNLDVRDAASKITSRTKAIIPVHLFGQAAHMDAVLALAREHDLAVVEDAAQAFGAAYKDLKVGGIGIFGAFSFFPTKNLGGFGDAGALVTNDDALAERARLLRTHGAKERYFHECVGGNFRLDAIHAALLGVKLPHAAAYTARRQAHAAFYARELGAFPGVTESGGAESCCLRGGAGAEEMVWTERAIAESGAVTLPIAYPHNHHIWNQYTIRVHGKGQRDQLRNFLRERDIGAEVYYPVPLHLQRCFTRVGKPGVKLPKAERLASECLSLPIYPELRTEQLTSVARAIGAFVEKCRTGVAA